MPRVFSPDDESIHWHDLSRLPEVGDLFLELADSLGDGPVSHELDAVIAPKKNAIGALIEVALPASYTVDPVKLLMRIARIKHYRGNRLPVSRGNVIAVSRLSGASAWELHRRQIASTPEEADRLRKLYRLIHRKTSTAYLDTVDPEYSGKNKHIIDTYAALGKVIAASDYYFHPPKNP
ncbi:MAG TPA: hypothetical protein VFH37_02745 [Candidatus Saccharimonadales bacterium]|nr:hypothetical protein [Candidatus Saccharimonadales bacterium]